MKPLISIIIPTFNRAHIIYETLDSIIEQTYHNWECIVIDDGSTDNTLNVLQKYTDKDVRFHYYKRPENRCKGASSCRNYGFELCKGQYVNWFDDDDLMMRDYLMTISECVLKKDKDLIFVDFLILKNGVSYEPRIECGDLIKNIYTHKTPAYLHRTFFKKSFINNFKLNEDLIVYEDWDYLVRVLLFRPEILRIRKPLYFYRIHEYNLTQTYKREKIYFSNSYVNMIDNISNLMKKEGLFDYDCQIYLLRSSNNYLKIALPNKEFYLSIKMLLIAFKRIKVMNLLKKNKVLLNFFKAILSFFIFGKGYKYLMNNK